MKAIAVILLLAVGFLGTGIIQTALRPFEVLVATWIGLAVSAVFWLSLVFSYLFLSPLFSTNEGSAESNNHGSPRPTFRLCVAIITVGLCIAAPIIARQLMLSEVIVPRATTTRAQWLAVEEKVGFRLALEDVGESQRIRFVRGSGRHAKVTDEFAQLRQNVETRGTPK